MTLSSRFLDDHANLSDLDKGQRWKTILRVGTLLCAADDWFLTINCEWMMQSVIVDRFFVPSVTVFDDKDEKSSSTGMPHRLRTKRAHNSKSQATCPSPQG
jgi:hypothetical protein